MRLTLSDEQSLIRSSVESLLRDTYDFDRRRRSLESPFGCHVDVWRRFAEMGWMAVTLPEEAGGLGGGAFELGLVMQGFGAHLVVEPYLTHVTAATLLAELGRDSQLLAWLPGLVDGSMRAAVAHEEVSAPAPWSAPGTTARRIGGGWELHGSKLLARGVPGAVLLFVTATVSDGGDQSPGGQRVFVLRPDTPGLSLTPAVLSDGSQAADARMSGRQDRVRRAARRGCRHCPSPKTDTRPLRGGDLLGGGRVDDRCL